MYDPYWTVKGSQSHPAAGLNSFSVGGLLGSSFSSALTWGLTSGIMGGATGGVYGAAIGAGIGLAAGLAYGAASYLWEAFDVGTYLWGDNQPISSYDFKRPMVNTRAAATMRQASMQTIMSSAQNYRQFLGREAARLHA